MVHDIGSGSGGRIAIMSMEERKASSNDCRNYVACMGAHESKGQGFRSPNKIGKRVRPELLITCLYSAYIKSGSRTQKSSVFPVLTLESQERKQKEKHEGNGQATCTLYNNTYCSYLMIIKIE